MLASLFLSTITAADDQAKRKGQELLQVMNSGKAIDEVLSEVKKILNNLGENAAVALATTNHEGRSALNLAVHLRENRGELFNEIIKELLTNAKSKNVIDVNAIQKGDSPLGRAAFMGYTGIVKLLCNHPKIDVNKYSGRRTPLMSASRQGRTDCVQVLLGKGADSSLETKDNDKETALIYAAEGLHSKVIKLLLADEKSKHKIDVNAQAKYNVTALYSVANYQISDYDKNKEIKKQKIKNCVDLLLKIPEIDASVQYTGDLKNALMLFAEKGDSYAVNKILKTKVFKKNKKKADLRIRRLKDEGKTALMLAVEGGHKNCVKALLDFGADPNLADKDGKTPLMVAAEQGYHEIVIEFLQNNKIDVNLTKKESNKLVGALWFAVKKKHAKCVEALVKYAGEKIKLAEGEKLLLAWTIEQIKNSNDNQEKEKLSKIVDSLTKLEDSGSFELYNINNTETHMSDRSLMHFATGRNLFALVGSLVNIRGISSMLKDGDILYDTIRAGHHESVAALLKNKEVSVDRYGEPLINQAIKSYKDETNVEQKAKYKRSIKHLLQDDRVDPYKSAKNGEKAIDLMDDDLKELHNQIKEEKKQEDKNEQSDTQNLEDVGALDEDLSQNGKKLLALVAILGSMGVALVIFIPIVLSKKRKRRKTERLTSYYPMSAKTYLGKLAKRNSTAKCSA